MSQKEKWEAVIKDYERSGLSQSRYAKQIGINESRLRYWKKKLAKENDVNDKSDFISITNEDKIELVVGGVIIKFPLTVTEVKLAELVKCLN